MTFGVIGIVYEPIGYHILRVEMIMSVWETKTITTRAHDPGGHEPYLRD